MRQTRSVLAVSTLFLFTLAGSDLFGWSMKDEAGHILEVGGHTQYRGRYYDLDFISDGNQSEKGNLNRHCYYGDLSLTFGITPNENVKAFFELNKLIFLGQEFKYNTIQTGEEVLPTDFTLPDGTKIPVRLNTDEAWEMHLRQAWLDVKIPKMKLKLKFGRQPFQLGNGIYTNTNIASVFGYQFYTDLGKDKPLLRFGSMKYYEGVRENYNNDLKVNDCDDADVFFGDLSVPVNKSKLGVFMTYFRDNSYNLDLLSHVNLGLTADLALPKGWTLKSEFDYQNGSKNYNGTQTDIDWAGYTFMINAAAPPILDKKLRLSFEYGFGSGDDPKTPNKFEGYVGVGPFYPYAFAYEYRFIHMTHTASGFFGKYSNGMAINLAPGMENTIYAKAQAMFMLPRNCNYIFSPIYLRMVNIPNSTKRDGTAFTGYDGSKTFGWEFDNILNVPVWKNFSYQFIFAIVLPGDWMKARDYNDRAFAIRNQLEVTF